MYVLPFFLYTNPEMAKPLLLHRYHTLDSARARAREMNIQRGALFPWRTICGEECSSFFPAGTAQVHINSDIAYAFNRSILATPRPHPTPRPPTLPLTPPLGPHPYPSPHP